MVNYWVLHMMKLRHNLEMAQRVNNKGLAGVGWSDIKDLNKYKTPEEFQHVLKEVRPDETRPMRIAIQSVVLNRWTNEVKKDDTAIVPMINDTIKIGVFLEDKPFRDSSLHPDYSHVRKVEWLKDVKRSEFTQNALDSIGSALTLSRPSEDFSKQVDMLLKEKKLH